MNRNTEKIENRPQVCLDHDNIPGLPLDKLVQANPACPLLGPPPPREGGEPARRYIFKMNYIMESEETGLEFVQTNSLVEELFRRHPTAVMVLSTDLEGAETPPKVFHKGNLLRCHAGLLIAASTLAGYPNPVAQWIESPLEGGGLIEDYLCALATRYAGVAIYCRSEDYRSDSSGDATLKSASIDGVETLVLAPGSVLGRFYEFSRAAIREEKTGIATNPVRSDPQSLEDCPLPDLMTSLMGCCQDLVAVLRDPVTEGDPKVAVYWKLRDIYYDGSSVEEVEEKILAHFEGEGWEF